ncbi:SMC-Scp complex subunit ScpB [Membranihabitans marinus]|uniref:SMC-Scp complex subunit ScpB n=1 Tax=Membranihabitans marinus TaxID=1227546 RepID=UPI001F02554E|nr:SMC-Scp complex subunit ScpB [Membranihabitans marinus]
MKNLTLQVESLIFIANPAISLDEIGDCLEKLEGQRPNDADISNILDILIAKYAQGQYSFEIVEMNDGFRFMTKGQYQPTIASYIKQVNSKKLSNSALETLSIIAYKQPIAKSEIEQIRGVNCDYTVQKLLEKELITITGRSEKIGKALLYGTSDKFMDYFGLKSMDDLPKLKDFENKDRQSIGENDEIATEAVKNISKN